MVIKSGNPPEIPKKIKQNGPKIGCGYCLHNSNTFANMLWSHMTHSHMIIKTPAYSWFMFNVHSLQSASNRKTDRQLSHFIILDAMFSTFIKIIVNKLDRKLK